MRIIFTEKLSKMVAHYENLRDWDSGEENIEYHGQDLLTVQNPERNSKWYQQPEWSSS